MADKGKWKCNYCDREDGVVNGHCPDCKATQTTPLDEKAKKEAGVLETEAFHKRNEDSVEAGEKKDKKEDDK